MSFIRYVRDIWLYILIVKTILRCGAPAWPLARYYHLIHREERTSLTHMFFANGYLDGRSFVAICTLATSGLANCQDYKFDRINFKPQ